mgnify:CR=1 FL=1
MRRSNAGVRRVEILRGNVGYLDLSNFFRPEEARDTIALGDASAQQGGRAHHRHAPQRRRVAGHGRVSAGVSDLTRPARRCSRSSIVRRNRRTATHFDATLPAERDGKRPIAVLTSAQTFSGGEGLAFLLQERHRAGDRRRGHGRRRESRARPIR